MRKQLAVLTATAAIAVSLATSGMAANAATVPSAGATLQPQGACNSSDYFTSVTSSSSAWKALSTKYSTENDTSSTVSNTVSITSSGSYSAALSGTLTGGISNAIVTAQASVSSSITKQVSWSTTTSVTVSVPAHSTRYAQYGTTNYTVHEAYQHYTNACVLQTVNTGTLTAPSSVGWKVTTS